jgi:hypothetical protein
MKLKPAEQRSAILSVARVVTFEDLQEEQAKRAEKEAAKVIS